MIAVIGDGSMTAGIAFEGLNQAGHRFKNTQLIVILNDNDMSISRNVGALSSFLSRKFSSKRLQEARKDFGDFLKSLPKIGDDIYQIAKRTEESFKTFTTPGMLFEAFDFEYFGPINGHKLNHLIDILKNTQNPKDIKKKIKKKIKVSGKDYESLLYNFLEELLFLFDSEEFFLSEVLDLKIKNNNLVAEIVGDFAQNYELNIDVKAITYNEMFVREENGKWVAQVVLDV